MIKQKLVLLAVVGTLSLTFTLAAAANITYEVNDVIAGGTVTGTITTNGMLGTIPNFGLPPNQFFRSYDLTLTVGANSTTLTSARFGGPFGQNLGQALTATATDLIWNFSAARAALVFGPGPGIFFGDPPCWELRAGAPALCGSSSTSSLTNGMVLAVNSSNFQTMPLSGTVVFAAVPEPSTLLLFGSGLLLFGIIVRRKQLHTRDGLTDVA